MGTRELRRDYGLELISRINRWLIAGAVAATGVLAYIADHSFPGHALSSKGTPVTAPAASGSSSSEGVESSSSEGVGSSGEVAPQQPVQAPAAAAPAPVTVVSGGS